MNGKAHVKGSAKATAAKAVAVPRLIVEAASPAGKGKKKKSSRPPAEPAYRPPLQESVPTDGKPRKNQVGLLSKELEHFRDLLLEKRHEIVGDMSSMEREALRAGGGGGLSSLPIHMADMGTDNYEQEFTLGLVEKDRNLLREINTALAKIQNGTYGLCEGTGKPISKARLEAQPWARFSIEWARQLEHNRGIR
jgi:RNA polymerase-binding protein DksA